MREPMTVWFTRRRHLRTDPFQLSAPYRDTTGPAAGLDDYSDRVIRPMLIHEHSSLLPPP
jgi:hypothetical protein